MMVSGSEISSNKVETNRYSIKENRDDRENNAIDYRLPIDSSNLVVMGDFVGGTAKIAWWWWWYPNLSKDEDAEELNGDPPSRTMAQAQVWSRGQRWN